MVGKSLQACTLQNLLSPISFEKYLNKVYVSFMYQCVLCACNIVLLFSRWSAVLQLNSIACSNHFRDFFPLLSWILVLFSKPSLSFISFLTRVWFRSTVELICGFILQRDRSTIIKSDLAERIYARICHFFSKRSYDAFALTTGPRKA